MKPAERYDRVGELLVAALDRPAAERGPFLEEACRGDALLRREVETLLRSHDAAGGFLAGTALSAMGLRAESGMEETQVGPYRLLREIGLGGMGVVYLAVRSDETFEKQVAVKLVKRGMDTEEIVRRFEKERRILAALDHPHIARILDGGTTGDGLPYFVMEYVDGLPILEYCDSRKLPTSERLRLFGSVCSAVAFAHQNLVVHRDLKPSNILVDSSGAPRLLDFGIAKLLAADEEATRTSTGLRPMTPWYSSPEQIRGEPINTSSDVYSLGVLLYEILAGRPPYRTAGNALSDLERAVCEEEPEKPSVAAGRREQTATPDGRTLVLDPEAIAAARDGDSRKLRRRLAGDVDTIVLLALQKDPRRRYASVEQLAEDIRRHLAGLPIRAHKDTVFYRGGKFVKRHAYGVAAAAAFALLALGATTYMAIQRGKIERERLRAEQISAFALGLFKGSDPREARGATLTVREILDRGGKKIERELSGEPEVQATLMDTIGGVYEELGLYEPAERMIGMACRTRRRIFGDRSLPVAESLQNLGELQIAMGKYPEAERLIRQALGVRRQLLGEKSVPVAETLESMGRVRHRQGDEREAASEIQSALATQRQLLGERHLTVANTWHSLGAVFVSLGRYDEAEAALRKALEIARASSDPDNPSVTGFRNDLGIALMGKGKFRDATALYRESSESRRRVVGEEHHSYAAVLANLAAALDLDGKSEDAEVLSRKALGIARRTLGENHPNMGFAWNNLATILRTKRDADGAESAAREALRIFRANLPERHLAVSAPLLNLGWALNAKGRSGEAEPLLRQAVEIRTMRLPEGDWRTAEAESVLGECLASQRRFEEASERLGRSYRLEKAVLGSRQRLTAETLERLVALDVAWHKPDQARAYRAELEAARASLPQR